MRIYKVSLATIFGIIAVPCFLDGYFVMQTAQSTMQQTNALLCYLTSIVAFGFFALVTIKLNKGCGCRCGCTCGCNCGPDCKCTPENNCGCRCWEHHHGHHHHDHHNHHKHHENNEQPKPMAPKDKKNKK